MCFAYAFPVLNQIQQEQLGDQTLYSFSYFQLFFTKDQSFFYPGTSMLFVYYYYTCITGKEFILQYLRS